MNSEQQRLLEQSWRNLNPVREAWINDFYARLFEVHPEMQPLFSTDPANQGRKLLISLNIAVNQLGRLDQVRDSLRELGRRHIGYGVITEHYQPFVDTLLESMAQTLAPEEFTPEVEMAWRAAFNIIVGEMLAGANEKPADNV